MKNIIRKLLILFCAIFSINIYAQITVTQNEIIAVGDVFYQAYDTTLGISINQGNPGSNQTWDFSSFQAQEVDTIEIISPNSTPFFSFHPTANLCVDQEDQFLYLEKNNTGVTILGFDDESFVSPVLPLPLTYGLSQSVGPTNAANSSIVNVFLPDSLSFLITMGQAHTIDSIKIEVNQNTDFNVDAFGNVILPSGTYDALRLKVLQTQATNYFAYCTDTLFGTGTGWYPAPSQFLPSETETIESYQWWTNNPSIKFALVTMELDSGIVDNVSFLMGSSVSSYDYSKDLNLDIFPNPVADVLNVHTKDNKPMYVKILDTNGRILFSKYLDGIIKLDVSSYSPGLYYLRLELDEEVIVKKIFVK